MNKIKNNTVEAEGVMITLPMLSEVILKEGRCYVSACPELGVTSQGSTRAEAHEMLVEATTLWLKHASAAEIKRQCSKGARVNPLLLRRTLPKAKPATKHRLAHA